MEAESLRNVTETFKMVPANGAESFKMLFKITFL